jgi:hypothetical protein
MTIDTDKVRAMAERPGQLGFPVSTVVGLLDEIDLLRTALRLACDWGDYPLGQCIDDAAKGHTR